MAKSKNRKNRKTGPHKSLEQIATRRASKNILTMLTKGALEGETHKLTIELEKGSADFNLSTSGGEARAEEPQLGEYIINLMVGGVEAGFTLTTISPNGEKHVRCWLLSEGAVLPATAEDSEGALASSTEAQGIPYLADPLVTFEDAYSLGDKK